MKPKKEQGESVQGSVVIGIDQSYTGFAVTVLGESGYWTSLWVLQGQGEERLVSAQRVVGASIECWAENHVLRGVAIEGYSHGAKNAAHMMGELGGAVKLAVYRQLGYFPAVVTPSQVKKVATGRGNASKAEVLLGCYKTWGIEFTNDNMADSFVVAKAAEGKQ